MKKALLMTAISVAAAATAVTQMPNAAQAGGRGFNQIGPSVTFGQGDAVFGINSKLGIANNLSLRPFVTFPSGGTVFGSSLTYDFDLRRSAPITPFLGAGIGFATGGGTTDTFGYAEGGIDFNISREFAISGIVDIPFDGGGTTGTVGANFRF